MVIAQLSVNFITDHATKHQHFIVSNFRKTFHLFLEYGELPELPILQITFKGWIRLDDRLDVTMVTSGMDKCAHFSALLKYWFSILSF